MSVPDLPNTDRDYPHLIDPRPLASLIQAYEARLNAPEATRVDTVRTALASQAMAYAREVERLGRYEEGLRLGLSVLLATLGPLCPPEFSTPDELCPELPEIARERSRKATECARILRHIEAHKSVYVRDMIHAFPELRYNSAVHAELDVLDLEAVLPGALDTVRRLDDGFGLVSLEIQLDPDVMVSMDTERKALWEDLTGKLVLWDDAPGSVTLARITGKTSNSTGPVLTANEVFQADCLTSFPGAPIPVIRITENGGAEAYLAPGPRHTLPNHLLGRILLVDTDQGYRVMAADAVEHCSDAPGWIRFTGSHIADLRLDA